MVTAVSLLPRPCRQARKSLDGTQQSHCQTLTQVVPSAKAMSLPVLQPLFSTCPPPHPTPHSPGDTHLLPTMHLQCKV